MTTPPLISVPLDDLIISLIGDHVSGIDKCSIPLSIAEALSPHLTDSIQYKILFQDFDGKKLSHPVLWRYTDWMLSAERYNRQKKRSEEERVARWIFNQNHNDLSKALSKSQGLTEEFANRLATKLLTGNAPIEILKQLGFDGKIITTEEELR